MDHSTHNQIVSFIWGIADDVLRDVYARGKYRDVILPMTVLRRLDALLEPTKDAVLEMKAFCDKEGIEEQDAPLQDASGYPFYNTSKFTLRGLLKSPTNLRDDFEAYLNGFSKNVQEIISKFKLYNQLDTLEEADVLYILVEKFLSRDINLSPEPFTRPDGTELPGLSNLGMGYVFEELIRKFNEENNEEAGEHFTPREIIRLMSRLIFRPIADQIESAPYLVYDPACGTGGMLTESEEWLLHLADEQQKKVQIHLYGQEINPETYAICQSDMLIKSRPTDNIGYGSTLSADRFPRTRFDFMLSNPPYGKSWKNDLDKLCGGSKDDMVDPRFRVTTEDGDDLNFTTRSSDGQLMFLATMVDKMKHDTPLGSRIVSVHNGSALFTGDAGQGESNFRRHLIESDYLEAIVALPLNLFYNTGIATYLWVVSNRKPAHRRGKVQLIDATAAFSKLRKNLGKKNCELRDEHLEQVMDAFMAFEEREATEENPVKSKIFDNADFGYWKIVVERPLRLSVRFSDEAIDPLRFRTGPDDLRRRAWDKHGNALLDPARFKELKPRLEKMADAHEPKLKTKARKQFLDPKTWQADADLHALAQELQEFLGADRQWDDFAAFEKDLKAALKDLDRKLATVEKKALLAAVTFRNPDAAPVIKKRLAKYHTEESLEREALYGTYKDKGGFLQYESDSELRDTEQVPLTEPGGIEAYFQREVKPHVGDAWIDGEKTQIGYEIPFTRHFYEYQPLRPLEEIAEDLRALEAEAEQLLEEVLA
ncbi:N-6 DNA methylase [Haloferula sp. A504]|uniref:type I restriction-modification system subunit M n=1 Tax=Haloferula sp. A504 TaxID=3373601 RepID=UPI0031C35588|nr:type I restriction-modification system subunit M [Verrucomicrobiaceae bacterium E54]